MSHKISLSRYLVEQQRSKGNIPSQLRLLLEVVARACRRDSHRDRARAGARSQDPAPAGARTRPRRQRRRSRPAQGAAQGGGQHKGGQGKTAHG